ncbi:tetraspanin-16 [Clonorchis sinensis]|uniref:Tetraspanin-16 n=1 Tax=Clonorchis sinensis TaxID=79923 RepID=G7YV13_CLOSI|nr:tetraspanin-16 [Clonorchis sinensis]
MYNYYMEPVDAYLTYMGLTENEAAKTMVLAAILEFVEPFGQIAFWIGLCTTALCCIGLYGASVQSRFILFLFSSMLLAKVLILAVIIIAFHAQPGPVVETFRVLLTTAVKGYKNLDSLDKHSLLLNVMMPHLKCCGVTGAEDFTGSKNFDNQFVSNEGTIVLRYPVSCCKRKENYDKLPNKCPEVFDERNSYIKTGCWSILEGQVLSALTKVSFIVIFTILIEFTLACFSIYATMTMEEVKTSQV